MPEYDIALELARLHILSGADFVRQLKILSQYNIFKPVDNEKDIFAAEGSHQDDFPMLLDAARKAVARGNKVYILPNPKGIRTADFIFENKGIYKMYDLKTNHTKTLQAIRDEKHNAFTHKYQLIDLLRNSSNLIYAL